MFVTAVAVGCGGNGGVFNEASFEAGTILFFSMVIYFIIDNFNYQGRPDITT